MSIYKNGKLIAGGRQCMPLLSFMWADHVLNDASWLRADTYSWQSGAVYQAAYQHLEDEYNALSTTSSSDFDYNDNTYVRFPAEDHLSDSHPYAYANIYSYPVNIVYADEDYISMSGSDIYNGSGSSATNLGTVTSISTLTYRMPLLETIAGVKIMYYVAQDGHKIVLTEMESAVAAIYSATGVAWYYIIDTANTRFKLPRINPDLEELTYQISAFGDGDYLRFMSSDGSNKGSYINSHYENLGSKTGWLRTYNSNGSLVDLSNMKLSDVKGQSGIKVEKDTIFSGKKYLYFYVGNFTQTAIENTAGLNAELFNEKVDVGHQVIEFQEPNAGNNYTWYRKYADGWVEQGGIVNVGGTTGSITLAVEMADTNYQVMAKVANANISGSNTVYNFLTNNYTTTGFGYRGTYNNGSGTGMPGEKFFWEVKGMAA